MNKINIKIILSKFIALVLISIPLGTWFFTGELETKDLLNSLSHQEVLDHLSTRSIRTPFESIAIIFGFGLFLLISVEVLAFGIKKIFDLFTKKV